MTPNWEDANCAGYSYRPDVNADLFFPDNSNHLSKRAKEMCNTCPIVDACLNWALNHERWGYWANTDPEQRDRIRKTRGIVLTPPPGGMYAPPCETHAAVRRHRRAGETCHTCLRWEARDSRERERRRKEKTA